MAIIVPFQEQLTTASCFYKTFSVIFSVFAISHWKVNGLWLPEKSSVFTVTAFEFRRRFQDVLLPREIRCQGNPTTCTLHSPFSMYYEYSLKSQCFVFYNKNITPFPSHYTRIHVPRLNHKIVKCGTVTSWLKVAPPFVILGEIILAT